MKKTLTLILLLCTTLLSARSRHLDAWQEIDTLIAQGHYATAYEKSGQQLSKAKRKGDGHSILKAVYKQRVAAAAYQEEHVEGAIAAYKSIIPSLEGADKAIANMLLGTLTEPKRTYYEAALAESEALKAIPTEDYDLLVEGDTLGLRLRPTLYDVVVHTIVNGLNINREDRFALSDYHQHLMGTAEEFVSFALPDDTTSNALWKLAQLQILTRYHRGTVDAAIRAHIDYRRMELLRPYSRTTSLEKEYVSGLERIAESYRGHPVEEAMFLYLLVEYYAPKIYDYTSGDVAEKEVRKALKMEEYMQRINAIAPDSEWNVMAKAQYKHATNPHLILQGHATLLPEQEQSLMLTVRNVGDIAYRIVPRFAGEHNGNFVFKEVIGRKSVARSYYKVTTELPNAYVYKKIPLTLPPLDAGDYFVIATNNGATPETKRNSITAISVTNLKMSMILHGAEAEYICMVLNATTGEAATDCEVALMESSGKQTRLLERFFPDEKGYVTIPLPSGSYRNLYLRASDGLSHTTYKFRYNDFADHRYWANSKLDASTLFTFLPDRYTYEPGDTVHFSIVAYSHSEEGSSVKGHLPVGVMLSDARRKEIGTLQGFTDEWGCYSGSIALPKDVTPGRFRLQATDSLSGRTMSQTINVEAFKAPTFTAEIEHPVAIVRFGDSLTLQGTATTYTGLPVVAAKVGYEIMANTAGVFGYHPLNDAFVYSLSDTTFTDEKGYFSITFKAGEADVSYENTTCNYSVTAHITDLSGETQSTQASIIVGQRTKHTNLLNWKGMVMHGDSIGYSLHTLNGQRIAEPVNLRLSRLEVPHYAGIIGSDESGWEQWREERILMQRCEQSSAESDNYISITPDMPCGIYRLTVSYTDGGKQYSEHCHFKLWGEGKGTESSYALYTIATDEHKVATGDTAMFYLGTRHRDVYAHYYIKVEDRIVDKGTLCLTDETIPLRIPVKEEWRGTLTVSIASVKDNVKRTSQVGIRIEDKDNLLNLHLSTLRSPLDPGDREQCTISVSDHLGKPLQATLTLSIYDAALDVYGQNYWDFSLAPRKTGRSVEMEDDYQSAWADNTYVRVPLPINPKYYALPDDMHEEEMFYSMARPVALRGQAKNRVGSDMVVAESLVLDEESAPSEASSPAEEVTIPYLRQDLRHTALFIPALNTDEQGRATFTLTAPDLLTRWHIKGIAHTKELKHGCLNVDFITRKTLMVQPNVPRFLYEGDVCDFTAKVTNSGDKSAPMVVNLEVESPIGTIVSQSQTLSGAKLVESVSSAFTVPTGITLLTYRITAQSGTHGDGEQGTIIVLPRRTLVTETMALYLNGKETREFTFEALKANRSTTLAHHSLSLDVVSNPLWYVIEALPPLCEESNPSYEQLFHRYYAASLGAKLIEQCPEVEGYADFYQRDSLMALQQTLLGRLAKSQHTDGGWPWMEGFASSYYMSQLIVKGIGELEAMGCIAVAQDDVLYSMVKQGVAYLDRTTQESFGRMEHKPKTLDCEALYYLYVRSMYPELPFGEVSRAAYDYYRTLLLKDKATHGTLMQKALKMLALIRMGESDKARKVAEVVCESSLSSDEMGIYWRDNRYGYSWSDNPIATQALLIEAFVQLSQPTDIVARMQQWLLKQKQTTHWGSSIATAQAVHALVGISGGDVLAESGVVAVKVGGKAIDVQVDDTMRRERLGLIQQRWTSEEISPALAKVSLEQQAEIPAWGSMTWQYYEDADKVASSGTGLSLKSTYYKVEHKDGREVLTALPKGSLASPIECHKGDSIRVCLQFTADRAMDYIELRMHRPAALEPMSTRSGYTYGRGLAYYSSIENTRNVYYLQRIDKGHYTIECDFWVSQSGTYSCGLSTIQCMYAPAFIATSESMQLEIK